MMKMRTALIRLLVQGTQRVKDCQLHPAGLPQRLQIEPYPDEEEGLEIDAQLSTICRRWCSASIELKLSLPTRMAPPR